ncbi:site-specific integrase [uncultured Alteromonas sp.]|uniref:tyrosine-type recombinase/integrase n=1 Tax=uncultured Alteromonas sp. TaxID=179113 RepID=UPI0030D43157|tara:strand:+ start:7466 stop:8656 length:1191 start_codon:yes stop_codon:yes gene_type:complete
MPIFVDIDHVILPIPNLYIFSTYKNLSHYVQVTVKTRYGTLRDSLDYRPISSTTANQYVGRLFNYLDYLNYFDLKHGTNFFYAHVNIPEEILNDYINDELILNQGKGDFAVKQAKDAIQSYYNFLAKIGLTTLKDIFIRPKLLPIAIKNTKPRLAVKYLGQSQKNTLYRCCKKHSHKIALRLGAEAGLRSKELRGLRLADFVYFRKKHKGILSLIEDMERDEDKTVFIFFLQGTYSKGSSNKGGRSRNIYISRELLNSIREYIGGERKQLKNQYSKDSLLLQKDGYEIPNCFGTNTFNSIKNKALKRPDLFGEGQALVHKDHSFHTLRHSFGTDKFHEFCDQNKVDPDSITPDSAVMIEVARLLGHSLRGKAALETTGRYIRSLHEKLNMEGGFET